MSYRDGHFQDLKVPLTWTVGVAVVVAIVAAVALLLSDRRETLQSGWIGVGRAAADVAASPVGQAISAPGRWTGQATQYVKDYFFAVSENRRLRAENAELRQWKANAVALEDTNSRYRALLGFKTNPPIPMASAHVILDSHGPFADTRLADAGKEKGIEIGNPVMNERGLVGRVIGVAPWTSSRCSCSPTSPAARRSWWTAPTPAPSSPATPLPRPSSNTCAAPTPSKRALTASSTSGDEGMIPARPPGRHRGQGPGRQLARPAGRRRDQHRFRVRILLFKDFSLLADQQELSQPAAPSEAAAGRRPCARAPAPAASTAHASTPAAAASTPTVAISAPRPAPPPAPAVKVPAPDAVAPPATPDKSE